MTSHSLPLDGKRLLVVDDEPNLRLLLRQFFEDHGADVTTAENGFEALTTITKNTTVFHAVILDVIMPTMDGVTTCRSLRDKGIMLPVIFTSGFAESDEIYKLRQGRSIYFVQKPYMTDMLLNMVVSAVSAS